MSEQPKIVSIPEVELDAKDARIAELEAEVARLRSVVEAAKHQRDTWNDYMNGDKAALVEGWDTDEMAEAAGQVSAKAPVEGEMQDCPRCGLYVEWTGYAWEHTNYPGQAGTLSCPIDSPASS